MTPLGNWLVCAPMVVPQERESGLILPERPKANDAMVLYAPDGRTLDNGEPYPIEVEPGDRVIMSPAHYREWENGEGFVRIEDVVARIPGPEYSEVKAMNQYALVEPVLIQREEERESGVIVSHRRLRGGESRDLERGERLHQEFHARGRQLLHSGLCAEERQDILMKEYRDLPPVDREALKVAREMTLEDGDTGYQFMRPTSSATDPRRGLLVSLGPGRVLPDGKRETPLCLRAGMKVHWSERKPRRPGQIKGDPWRVVELWDGFRILFAMDWRALCAYE